MQIVITPATIIEILQKKLYNRHIIYRAAELGIEIFAPHSLKADVTQIVLKLEKKKRILHDVADELLQRIYQNIKFVDLNDYHFFLSKTNEFLTSSFQETLQNYIALLLATEAVGIWDNRDEIMKSEFTTYQLTTSNIIEKVENLMNKFNIGLGSRQMGDDIRFQIHPDDKLNELEAESGFNPGYVKWIIKYDNALRSGLDPKKNLLYNELPLLTNVSKVKIYNIYEHHDGYVLMEEYTLKKDKIPKFYWNFFITSDVVDIIGYQGQTIQDYIHFNYRKNSESHKDWYIYWKGEPPKSNVLSDLGEKYFDPDGSTRQIFILDSNFDELLDNRERAIKEYNKNWVHVSETLIKFGFFYPNNPEECIDSIHYLIHIEEKPKEFEVEPIITIINGSYVELMTMDEDYRRRILLNSFDPKRKERFIKRWAEQDREN